MKLFYRIYSILLIGIIALLALDGYLSFNREVSQFDIDMTNNAILIGRIMSGMISQTWKEDGKNGAINLIQYANSSENNMKFRWVWMDALPNTPDAPYLARKKLDSVFHGESASFKIITKEGYSYRYTYVPVRVESQRFGALELIQPMSQLTEYANKTLLWSFIVGSILLLTSGLILYKLFNIKIRGPLDQLSTKAKRIGDGDLSPDLILKGDDEFANLASVMNDMCRRLKAAKENIRTENEARISALEQLRHTERLSTLGRLSAGIAHEMGTPLNIIAGRAKLITSGGLEKNEVDECSRIIQEQANRMTKLIQQFLDFARRRKPRHSPENIVHLASQVFEMLRPTALKQNVKLFLVNDKDVPIVSIDASQIQQVLINMTLNGIQAMLKGGKLELEIHTEISHPFSNTDCKKRKYLTMNFLDEGGGIAEESIKHIFDPFFTTKDVGQGTGLGLSIAYGIIEEHGGWIDVKNDLGKGVCFKIFLPAEVTI